MGRWLELEAADGFLLKAYRSDPSNRPLGAVVVVQEIFGVNRHIRSVCDRLSNAGYIAVAPAIFDRIQRDFESGYSAEEIEVARKFVQQIDWDKMLLDVGAAVDLLKPDLQVGILGFCLGGSVAFLAATKLSGLAAASCFYGGAIRRFSSNAPLVPTQVHFGENDHSIPLEDVEAIRQSRPEIDIFVYEGAQHGFNCDARSSYDPKSADLAWRRTSALFSRHLKATSAPGD